MPEIEVPTEHLHEEINHRAKHATEGWIMGVALTSSFLAVFAAVSALLAGHHSNEAMITQVQSSDAWAHYQAKSIKSAIAGLRTDLFEKLNAHSTSGPKAEEEGEYEGKSPEEYKTEQLEIEKEARKLQAESEHHLAVHVNFARAVTLFQIAIAISAIAVLAHKRVLWLISIGVGGMGIIFAALALCVP